MEFALGEDERIVADTTRRFLEAECPLTVVRQLADTEAGFDRDWWKQGASLGWTSLLIDDAHGGAGLGADGLRFLGLIAEEMGRLVSPGPLVPTNVVAAALNDAGTSEQQATWLPPLADGTAVGAWVVAQRRAAAPDALRAVRDDGHLVVSGAASPVEAAADADVLLVTAEADDGPVQVVLPSSTEGITIERRGGLDLVRRFATVRFDDVAVPLDAVVGEVGGAAEAVEHQLQIALALQCVESAGAAARVLDFTVEYATDRYSFGRPLASYQALKHRFADMKLWLEASHATADAAVRSVAEASPDAWKLVRAAKSYVGDHLPELVQDCVQMHGGIGVTWEHDIHLYLRRVTTNRWTHGDPSVHREALAARLVDAVEEER